MRIRRDRLLLEWLEFHQDNPHIYDALVRLARQGVAAGHHKLGIGQLFEVLRWEYMVSTRSRDGFKLNNNHRALYAREIMRRERDLRGVFDTRERRVVS